MTAFNFPIEPILERTLPEVPLDLRLATPEKNFASSGVAREVNSIYQDDAGHHVIWQPDVYAEARTVAIQNGITKIVDVGCGNGEKLVHFFPSGQFETVGLDFHGSLALARGAFPDSRWIETDLNSTEDLAAVFGPMDSDVPVLLILSDVIEHLPDPRLLLAQLRLVLMRHPGNRLVLSTPDRELQDYISYGACPENSAHVREWSHQELAIFCLASGFQVERYGHTRANQFDEKFSTIYVQLRCHTSEYVGYLQKTGLLHSDSMPKHLLVTSEYAGLHGTGGIGTFVAEQRLSYGEENTLCLFVGGDAAPDCALYSKLKLIRPELVIHESSLSLPTEDIALQATLQLLFYFPDLAKIEYADYQGLGCRLAQAKRASMLPLSVETIAHCHGATHYLENANQTWYGQSHFCSAEREKISIESADRIVFPTRFLHDLYLDSGFDLPAEKVVQLRYPFQFSHSEITATEIADTIVYFGKRSTMKGYSLFLAALASDSGQLAALGVKRIVFIGPEVSGAQQDVARLEYLRSRYEISEFSSLGRSAAMAKLQQAANSSVCVMPYLGDNHPYALLDVTFSGVLPLLLRAGGVAELIPAPFDRMLLAEPTEASLLRSLTALIRLSTGERHRLRKNFLSSMASLQTEINSAVKDFGKSFLQSVPFRAAGKATIIVPVFNTERRFIEDLVFGLNNQSMPPEEVIFVDDASVDGYSATLNEQLKADLRLPYRIIRHAVNKGLAGARNTGLAAVRTEYVINVDSDDVPLTDFVRNIVRRLDSDGGCAAAVPYLKAFDEESDFNEQCFGGYVYRPLGDGVIASQVDNYLGHANSGFRTAILRDFGGWDETEKSMWEDWALFLKLASNGARIAVIPRSDCLYRVRKQSMLRTYKVWPAMRRLARNMGGLPRYENFRLQAVMRQVRDESAVRAENASLQAERAVMQSELVRICEEHAAMRAELNRRSIRATRRIVLQMTRFPRALSAVRAVGLAAWKTARRARNIIKSK